MFILKVPQSITLWQDKDSNPEEQVFSNSHWAEKAEEDTRWSRAHNDWLFMMAISDEKTCLLLLNQQCGDISGSQCTKQALESKWWIGQGWCVGIIQFTVIANGSKCKQSRRQTIKSKNLRAGNHIKYKLGWHKEHRQQTQSRHKEQVQEQTESDRKHWLKYRKEGGLTRDRWN